MYQKCKPNSEPPHYLYSNTWNPPADLASTNQKFSTRVQEARRQFGSNKIWVATVMPGYNDTRIRLNGFAQARAGGAYYEQSWLAAIHSGPDWIVVTSFNEWPEGSQIEPSITYGDHYLNLTSNWSQQFKSGASTIQSTPTIRDHENITPFPAEQSNPQSTGQIALPTTDGPTARVQVALLNLRSMPNTNAEILAQLPQNSVLPIIGQQTDWWQVRANNHIGWLYAPFVQATNVELLSNSQSVKTAGLARIEKVEPSAALDSTGEGTTQPLATINVSLLNVRLAPTTAAAIIHQLSYGESVPIVGQNSDNPTWWQVKINEIHGWVYAPFVHVAVPRK
ncbi:SH3 domain-containing protein [Chloroflexi bacterium TSY]|nr:SH3 domain-containing protein [Chloroflexi bacterium TSY]